MAIVIIITQYPSDNSILLKLKSRYIIFPTVDSFVLSMQFVSTCLQLRDVTALSPNMS